MKILFTILLSVLYSLTATADIKFSGYGSIIAGQTLGTGDDPINAGQKRDERLVADFYDVGFYTNDVTFKAESIFALQSEMDVGPGFKVTAQLVAKAVDDFQPEFDWYYLTYQASERLTLMAGRRNIPMYYFSEYSEVGYAYPWMRPPSNLYWWQITQFNGIHARYDFDIGEYSSAVTVFYGNEYSKDNPEMKYYEELYGNATQSVDEIWTDILGVNWSVTGDTFDVRFVYFQNHRDRDLYRPSIVASTDGTGAVIPNQYDYVLAVTSNDPFSQTFIGVGGSVDVNMLTILFDMNFVEYDDTHGTQFPTYLLSGVYNIDKYQPYISYSKADHKRTKGAGKTDDLEEHYILGLGVRYNFLPKASLKVQFDHFEDEGDEASGWRYHGNSDTITAGVDFIF